MPPKWLDLLDVRLKEDTALSRLYEEKGPITQGAQAGCFLVMHKETGVHHSMRVYQNDDLSQWKLDELSSALTAQRKLNDAPAQDDDLRCLSRLHEVLGSPKRTLVISELTPTQGGTCTDLFTLVEKRGRIGEQDARQIFSRLVLAVKAAHSAGVVLRNVKPEGVQVRQRGPDSEWAVWLADLHCAAPIKEGAEDECMAGNAWQAGVVCARAGIASASSQSETKMRSTHRRLPPSASARPGRQSSVTGLR